MPMYSYSCECGRRDSAFRTIANRYEAPMCRCGKLMHKVFDAPRVVADYAGYACPVTGSWIEGRRAHEENLKRTGSRLLEPGENAEIARRNAAADAALEDRVADTAAAVYESFSPEKKEALAVGFSSGLDLSLSRS